MKKNTIITTILLSASFLFISSLPLLPQNIGQIFKGPAFPKGESSAASSLKSSSEFDSASEFKPYSGSPDNMEPSGELSLANDPLVSRSLSEPRRARTQNTAESVNAKNAQKNESIHINQNHTATKANSAETPNAATTVKPAETDKSTETAQPAYVAKPATTANPATATKPTAAKPAAAKPSNTQSTGSYSASDIDLLARLITAEAQGEPYAAQVGVGAVILNRIQSKEFPNTIPGVIYQTINGYAQFTPVVNGWINKPALPECIKAANESLNGADPTNGALFYYDNTTTNQWILSKPVSTKIGTMVYAY